MGHDCNCHDEHGHCDCNSHNDDYYYYENGYHSGRFSESDGTIVGWLLLIIGIIILLVKVFT